MGLVEPIVFLCGVVMGTGSTITIKVIYGLEAIGMSGHRQRFEKPLTTTWIMFVAMMLALPAFWLKRTYQQHMRNKHMQKKLNGHSEHQPILGIKSTTPYEEFDDEYYVEQDVPWKTYFLLVIPAVFDLLGTALSSIGLLFTTVSVYQLLRCSVIIVTAILKTTVLGHKLTKYMWTGIFINTVAMILVALTSYIDPVSASGDAVNDVKAVETESRDPAVGILFILMSCIVQGSQYVFEEKVMAVDNAPPLVVVGMEGVWGTLLMPLVVFPWAYILPGSDAGGCFENVLDAYVMLQHSRSIQIILAIFTVTVFLYNIFCIYVTYLLDSVWHSILDNFRPVSVWGTDLLLFYVITGGAFGESWGNGSFLQLAGLILLFIGTAVYNSTIKLPGFDYTSYEEEEEDEHLGIPTQQAMSSPYLARSPLLTFRSLTPKQGPSSRNTGAYGSVGAGPTNWPSYGSGLLSSPLNGSNGFGSNGGGSSYPSARSGR